MNYYIDYLDCKNKFKQARIEFETYQEAKTWLCENIENAQQDMIKMY